MNAWFLLEKFGPGEKSVKSSRIHFGDQQSHDHRALISLIGNLNGLRRSHVITCMHLLTNGASNCADPSSGGSSSSSDPSSGGSPSSLDPSSGGSPSSSDPSSGGSPSSSDPSSGGSPSSSDPSSGGSLDPHLQQLVCTIYMAIKNK